MAAPFEQQVLRASITPLKGQTPYVFWGDAFILVLAIVLVGAACYGRIVVDDSKL